MEPKEFDIEFPRGDTCPITFNLTDENGNLLTNWTEIYFTIKRNYITTQAILQKKFSLDEITYDEEKKQFKVILEHTDTASLPYGNYVYDIQVKSDTYFKTVCIGTITLTNEVTHLANE